MDETIIESYVNYGTLPLYHENRHLIKDEKN